MDLENVNFKAKDVIQFSIYLISATFFFLSMSAKVDKVTDAVQELKNDKKEFSIENKANILINQNDIKALTIRAELNRQNIEIIKSDIENLKETCKRINN